MNIDLSSPISLSAHKLEQFLFIALAGYQLLIIFSVATDINGDPNDYIRLARDFFNPEVFSNFNRFIGYPLFIKLTSFNLVYLNLVFIVQLGIFLASLRSFAYSLSDDPLVRILVYLPAFLPAVAYLPKLLFPDCLLLSLFLLLCGSLLRRRFLIALLLIGLLTLIKLVFIFTFFWCALLFAAYSPKYARLTWTLYTSLLIFLVPVVYVIAPFALYQTTVQNPAFVLNRERPNPYPLSAGTAIACNNTFYQISDFLSQKNIIEHSSDALYMPLGPELASRWSCSNREIKAIQRQLIIASIYEDPRFHGQKFLGRYLRDLFVFPDAQHIWWMLDTKLHQQVTYINQDAFYSPTELAYFKSQAISPLQQPNLRLLASMVQINPLLEKVLSYFVIVGLAMGIVFWFKTKLVPKGVILILGLLASYSFVICFFAFGYDRYLLVNYFFWFGAIGLFLRAIAKKLQYKSAEGKIT